jgi:hypothetical protein
MEAMRATLAEIGGPARPHGGTLRRFVGVKPAGIREEAELLPWHPALRQRRTIFPSTVATAEEAPRLLVSGHNNPKLGREVRVGAWMGMPIFHLTLEERATCPASCHHWASCYGNNMHLARRHAAGAELEYLLGAELAALAEAHPDGFAVRLHTLGDFYSLRYAARWSVWLRALPELHLFGFTAWGDETPIGQMVERMNGRHPDRCAIRFSRAKPSGQGWEAVTVWRQPDAPRVAEGQVCPAQLGLTECCATCGLCWSPAMAETPIVFIGHGRNRGAAAR